MSQQDALKRQVMSPAETFQIQPMPGIPGCAWIYAPDGRRVTYAVDDKAKIIKKALDAYFDLPKLPEDLVCSGCGQKLEDRMCLGSGMGDSCHNFATPIIGWTTCLGPDHHKVAIFEAQNTDGLLCPVCSADVVTDDPDTFHIVTVPGESDL
jgi:hypothetical protein